MGVVRTPSIRAVRNFCPFRAVFTIYETVGLM
jgi:hypothetical protein